MFKRKAKFNHIFLSDYYTTPLRVIFLDDLVDLLHDRWNGLQGGRTTIAACLRIILLPLHIPLYCLAKPWVLVYDLKQYRKMSPRDQTELMYSNQTTYVIDWKKWKRSQPYQWTNY